MTTAIAEPKKAAAAKLTLPLGDLQTAMATVALAATRKTTIPVLSTVRIDGNTFTATDLDLSVRVTIASVEGSGDGFLVPAHKLESFGKLLQGQAVSIQADGSRATIRCGRSNTKVPTLDVVNFPNVAFMDGVSGVQISQAVAERMLDFTTFAVSKEESRYTLCGALLEVADGRISLVATDGHRLARYTAPSESACGPMLLPLKALQVIGKVLDADSKKPLVLDASDDALFANVEGDGRTVAVSSRKMTGQFPNYKAVIPASAAITLIVSAEEMLAALRRCSTFTDERSGAVRLTIGEREMHLNGASVDTGETDETVDVRTADTFETFKTGFCDRYLIEAFSRLTGDVEIRFATANGQTAMMLVAHPQEGEEFTYVAMPMRV